MRTPAHDHYDMHVAPPLGAWRANLTDLRLAMIAAVALYHVADHYWESHSQVDSSRVLGTTSARHFRAELAKQSDDFRLLRDVAEAHKHMRLDRSAVS